jgi:hypothetical protein
MLQKKHDLKNTVNKENARIDSPCMDFWTGVPVMAQR